MYSIAFPNMFSYSKTNVAQDYEATLANLKLILLSYKGELFGDPYYGSNLVHTIYEKSGSILKDLVIDDIFTTIVTFMPQLGIERNDINITSDGTHLYATLKLTNLTDYTANLYSINLTEGENK